MKIIKVINEVKKFKKSFNFKFFKKKINKLKLLINIVKVFLKNVLLIRLKKKYKKSNSCIIIIIQLM